MQRVQLSKFKLPDGPGVYFFKKGRKILYIGKAASLRDRVRSYFAADLASTRAPAIAAMVAEANRISYQTTSSVLEALILEANLIKEHQPPYNVDEKDNKSFNYVVITKEDFPRVLVVRGRELYSGSLRTTRYKPRSIFGPYPHGLQLLEALEMIRRIFPYRDSKCIPCPEQLRKKQIHSYSRELAHTNCKPCFNRQIGLCPGVCTGEITKAGYAAVVRNIKDLFSANFHGLKRRLAKEMQELAKEEKFEEAARVRSQIHALEHIRDVSLIKDEHRVASGGGARIEAFDVAHTAGQDTVAVMTVVQSGEPVKSAYRKFTIRTVGNDDVAALKEALSRRLEHAEWPLPRVFVVDGGKAQVRAAEKVLSGAGLLIPVVGVVKDEFHRPKHLIGDRRAVQAYERDLLLANSEAHRFAITWHRRRRRNLLTQ